MRAIHLHPDDPIAIVTGDTASGETILWEGGSIGIATQPIAPGDWVHLHNLQSTWLPTYTREENKAKV